MTKEEARKAAEVMLAYADGKKIERQKGENWVVTNDPPFDWLCSNYRIKSEPKYRPFKDAEECWQEMQKHQPFGWVKYKNNGNYTIYCAVDENCDFMDDFDNYTFADGSVFGINKS